ncbi:hypothetical protein Syun_023445 [Stephania yunnanensis]|uniref:Retrovirus-related Pol polyprotein from transposon TNT 1-94 n=1 Tax=Stephania yunnanensis TaxID=152371 RepID=A0AAP0F9N6_9MAGN
MYNAIHIKASSTLTLISSADVDWASSLYDSRSIAGYSIYFGRALASWQSKKQHVVAHSST